MVDKLKQEVEERYLAKGLIVLSKGFPDLVVLENGSIKFIEVKDQGQGLNKNQRKTIRTLIEQGFEVTILKRDSSGLLKEEDVEKAVQPVRPVMRGKLARAIIAHRIVEGRAKYLLWICPTCSKAVNLLRTWTYTNPKYKGKFRRLRDGQLVMKMAPNVFLFDGAEDTLDLLLYLQQKYAVGEITIWGVTGEVQMGPQFKASVASPSGGRS